MEQQSYPGKAKWAKIMHVSSSGYYDWKQGRAARKNRREKREHEVLAVFSEGKGHYGAERICGVIRERGGHCSFSTVNRVMKQHNLYSSHCKRKQRSLTDSRAARDHRYENLTKDLEIARPFQVLSSDITYIRTSEGVDYLCQIKDCFSNMILGVCQQERMTADIVLKALENTQKRWKLPAGVIFHSDRGSQYTAKEVKKQIEKYAWKQSWSAVGRPGDNAWSESFFSLLKKEMIHYHHYSSREELRQSCFEYIFTFYNHQRAQKRLGYISPAAFIQRYSSVHSQDVA